MANWESKLFSIGARSAQERIAIIAELVSEWCGPAFGVENAPTLAPEALRRFYAVVGGSLESLCRQNRILAPDNLRSVAGKVEFAVENQYVFSWAVESQQVDPPVFYRFSKNGSWAFDVPALSLFLTQFTIFELLMAAPFGASASWLATTELDAVLNDMVALPMPHWHCPVYPGRFFARGNAFAFCCPNGGLDEVAEHRPHSFWLGARDAADVEFIKSHIDSTWDHVSL